MATDLERLVVSLEANIKNYERQLKKALDQTNSSARAIERRFAGMNKNVAASFDFGGSMTRALGAVGLGVSAGASIQAISKAAQEYTNMQNALKVTGLEGEALEKTFASLYRTAQSQGTAIGPLVTLYSRLSSSQKELNASSSEMEQFTNGVALAMRVAGTDSQAASGALLQLSQAMGGGVIQAQEFNSLIDGARPILQAVAAGMKEAGGSVAELSKLVKEGEISSEAFFRAFLAGMPQLESQSSKTQQTIGQALTRVSNAFIVLIGHMDTTLGTSQRTANELMKFAAVVERMGSIFDGAIRGAKDFAERLRTIDEYLKSIGKFLGENTAIGRLLGIGAAVHMSAFGPQQAVPPASAGGRIAEGARDPSGTAPAPRDIQPISYKDFAVKRKDEGGRAGLDPFQRAIAQIERRTAVLNAETAAIDLGAAAQARARVETELETAAKRANEAAGLKNTEVTDAQRQKITELADAYMRAAQAAEAANSPLNQFARAARDSNMAYQTLAVDGLRSLEDGLADIVTGAENAADAFKRMAQSILADIARIAIRQGITGPIAAALGGMFGGGNPTSTFGFNPLAGAFSFGGARAGGGPVSAGKAYLVGERGPELFAPAQSGMVIPNSVARQAGGAKTVTYAPVINAPGASREDIVAAMEMAQRNFQRSILPTVMDARGRGAL